MSFDSRFPSPQHATPEGVIAVGGVLDVETLVDAYSHGIFPWPIEGVQQVVWFSPPRRGLLYVDEVHVSRSLRQIMRRENYRISMDTQFQAVLENCAQYHAQRNGGTWIRQDLKDAFLKLHRAGFAHSLEVWDASGSLSGGLYGVSIGQMFAGESMFHRRPNYSKIALVELATFLRERHVKWFDVQVRNRFTTDMGARDVDRAHFLRMLHTAVSKEPSLFPAHHGKTS